MAILAEKKDGSAESPPPRDQARDYLSHFNGILSRGTIMIKSFRHKSLQRLILVDYCDYH